MKLSNKSHLLLKGSMISAVLSVAGILSSCDSMIFDDQGDCSVHYRLSFRYTKNILNTDAFGSQVTDVNVALYDSNGNMVYKKTEHRNLSEDNNFWMDIDVLPGTYDIIAWCEGPTIIEDSNSFVLEGQAMTDKIQSSGAYLPLKGSEGAWYSDQDINRLYYGIKEDVEFADSYGIINIDPIYLTKDTNHITIQLQNMDGREIDPAILQFSLEGDNSQLNWQNVLAGDISFTYTPWSVLSTSTSIESRANEGNTEIPSGVIAEFTTGRIIAGNEQYLTVKLKDSEDNILRIPLVQYLLLVRGNYQSATSDQDYLDRYDDFTMTFFIDETYTWIKSRILINNWRVVPPQHSGLNNDED